MQPTISVFDSNVEYYLSQGLSPLEAKHKSIDYYRKFTRREITSEWESFSQNLEDESQIDNDQIVYVNHVFEQVLNKLLSVQPKVKTDKTIKLFFYTLRIQGVDEYLYESNQKLIKQEIGDNYPEYMWEVANLLGYKMSGSTCSALGGHRGYIRQTFKDLNLSL